MQVVDLPGAPLCLDLEQGIARAEAGLTRGGRIGARAFLAAVTCSERPGNGYDPL
jgi:hypothetical protein